MSEVPSRSYLKDIDMYHQPATTELLRFRFVTCRVQGAVVQGVVQMGHRMVVADPRSQPLGIDKEVEVVANDRTIQVRQQLGSQMAHGDMKDMTVFILLILIDIRVVLVNML